MFNSDTVYHHMVDNKSQTFITDTFKYRYETDTLDNNMILLRHRVLYEVNCIIKMMNYHIITNVHHPKLVKILYANL